MLLIDYIMLVALPCALALVLWTSRAKPRTALFRLIAACVLVPLLAALAFQVRSFGLLRMLAWGLFAALPLGAAVLAVMAHKTDRLVTLGPIAAAVLTLGVYGYAFHVEPYRLEVNHHRIATPDLAEPLRIVLVADLQTDRLGEYEQRAMDAVRDAKPDLVLMSGDYLQLGSLKRTAVAAPQFRALFQDLLTDPELQPRYGIHAVAGNCELGWDWEQLFEGTDIRTYDETQSVDVGPVRLEALSFRHSRVGRRIEDVEGRFQIALGHCPDFALDPHLRADLLLAGHCHGGQVRVPFFGPPITLSQVPRAWTQGLVELDDGRKLIVSRGIGMERGMAPRLRFLCRPEVVVIDLVPAD